VKCIRRYLYNGPLIILVLIWRKSTHFGRKYARKNDFYIFVHSDLDLWPLDLKFASVVTVAQTYVFTAFEISASFVLRENRRHGTNGQTDRQTDGHGATLNAPPSEGRIKLDHCYDQEFVISSPIAFLLVAVSIGVIRLHSALADIQPSFRRRRLPK